MTYKEAIPYLLILYLWSVVGGKQEMLSCDMNEARNEIDWCGFQNSNYTMDLRWNVEDDREMGRCLAVSDLDKYPGTRARLESVEVSLLQYKDACVSFYYHISGEGTALFNVIAETFNISSFSYRQWYIRSPAPTLTWRRRYINLSTDTHTDTIVKLLFDITSKRKVAEGRGGSVKINDLQITRDESCPRFDDEEVGTSKTSNVIRFPAPNPLRGLPTTAQPADGKRKLTSNARQDSITKPPSSPHQEQTTPHTKPDDSEREVDGDSGDVKSKIDVEIGARKPDNTNRLKIEANVQQEWINPDKQSEQRMNIDVSIG